MIFDSLRHARPATRLTFGVGRYNTRLNFYLYEMARLTFVRRGTFFVPRPVGHMTTTPNLETMELASCSYTISSRV